jgi:hypothetical protein
MKLREIFDQLAFSELAQLNGIDSSTGLIAEKSYDKVLSAVSLGLTTLHTRFCLKRETLSLLLIPGVYTYNITNANAVSKNAVLPYIIDSAALPYRNTLLKIESVSIPDGLEIPLNNYAEYYSAFTPNLSTLVLKSDLVDQVSSIPEEYKTTHLSVTYRANHKILGIGFNGYDADQVEIDLPYTYLEALLYFVGSRLHNPMGLVNDFNAGNNYAAKYERACQEIEKHNIRVDQDSQNIKLVRNGWV